MTIFKTLLSKIEFTMWWERWFLSCNAKDIGTLYLIFALFSWTYKIKLDFFGPGIQYIADNQLYNSIITAHAILMIFFMVMPAIIGIYLVWIIPNLCKNKVEFKSASICFWLLPAGIITSYVILVFGNFVCSDVIILILALSGISSLLGAMKLTSSILNMRAPGINTLLAIGWIVSILSVFAIILYLVLVPICVLVNNESVVIFILDINLIEYTSIIFLYIFGHLEMLYIHPILNLIIFIFFLFFSRLDIFFFKWTWIELTSWILVPVCAIFSPITKQYDFQVKGWVQDKLSTQFFNSHSLRYYGILIFMIVFIIFSSPRLEGFSNRNICFSIKIWMIICIIFLCFILIISVANFRNVYYRYEMIKQLILLKLYPTIPAYKTYNTIVKDNKDKNHTPLTWINNRILYAWNMAYHAEISKRLWTVYGYFRIFRLFMEIFLEFLYTTTGILTFVFSFRLFLYLVQENYLFTWKCLEQGFKFFLEKEGYSIKRLLISLGLIDPSMEEKVILYTKSKLKDADLNPDLAELEKGFFKRWILGIFSALGLNAIYFIFKLLLWPFFF